MTEERTSSIPAPEALEELQATIDAHLDAGAPDIAAAELEELRAPDQADVDAELSEPVQQALLGALLAETIAEIIEHLDVEDAAEISGLIDVDRMAAVLDRSPPEVAADILRQVDWTVASQVLGRMEDRSTIGELLLYPDDDPGGHRTAREPDRWHGSLRSTRRGGVTREHARSVRYRQRRKTHRRPRAVRSRFRGP